MGSLIVSEAVTLDQLVDWLSSFRDAVHEHCDAPTAAFLTACQTLRALLLLRSHRPDWLGRASERIQTTLTDWWA